jgi:hypothetical protein
MEALEDIGKERGCAGTISDRFGVFKAVILKV